TELGRRGIVDGTLRPLDIVPMSLVSASAHALLGQWLAPDEKRTPAQIAHEIGELLFRGLRGRTDGDTVGKGPPALKTSRDDRGLRARRRPQRGPERVADRLGWC